ncbi:MAG TPA: dimethylargininase [Acidimicrobiia bacterium]|nr:dimethylargininase [Acidimicrobiia bacterium]
MPIALLREVSPSFADAIVAHGDRRPDVARAIEQHSVYRRALDAAGYSVEVLPGDADHPDCVFIEDAAVVIGEIAVATRPGAEERRGEVGAVADRLARSMPVRSVEEPGTLDGGDVMVINGTVYVGRSKRSNDSGIRQLADIAATQGMPLVSVPVSEVLHLKSAVLPVASDTVVVTPGTVDESLLEGLRIVHEAAHERHRFSALPLADGSLLVTANAEDTAGMLSDLGMRPVPIDVSEIQAADGGLTCMSILFER